MFIETAPQLLTADPANSTENATCFGDIPFSSASRPLRLRWRLLNIAPLPHYKGEALLNLLLHIVYSNIFNMSTHLKSQ